MSSSLSSSEVERVPTRLMNLDFFLLWQGQFVSRVGSGLFSIAVMLWITHVTNSSSLVGLMMMIAGIPTVLSGTIGGVFADRFSRKKIIVISDFVSGALMLSLALLMFVYPSRIGLLLVAMFFVVTANGVVSSFFIPAVIAAIPSLVPKSMIEQANSLRQASFQIAGFVGQSLGGYLFRILGAPLVVFFNGISYWLSAISESFIRIPQIFEKKDSQEGFVKEVRTSLSDGVRFVLQRPGLKNMFFISAILNFFAMPIIVLLPFYVRDYLLLKDEWLGFLMVSSGVGALMGSIVAGIVRFQGKRRAIVLLAIMLMQGLLPVLLGLFIAPAIAMTLTFMSGLLGSYIFVNVVSILQLIVPSQVQGRIFGFLNMFSASISPLGAGLGGVIGDMLGKNVPLIYVGCGTIIFLLIALAALSRDFRAILATKSDEDVKNVD